MALVKSVIKAFDTIAPLSLAASWDNVGLLLDSVSPTPQQTRIVLTVDLTETVFNALPPETALVVAYHPILFRPLKALTQADPLQRTLLRCAARNIAVYSPHTSLDAAEGGIDFWLASAFERQMKRLTRIRDASNPPEGHEGAGEGMRIELREPIDLDEAVSLIKSHLNMKTVMLARSAGKETISSIALCAGSGASALNGVDADLYWTGEMSHHEILAATASGHHVLLCNHSNTERGYLRASLQPRLQQLLDELNPDASTTKWHVDVSDVDRDPLEFF